VFFFFLNNCEVNFLKLMERSLFGGFFEKFTKGRKKQTEGFLWVAFPFGF